MTLTTTQRRALSWLTLGLVFVLFLWLLAPVLTPFIVGAVLAYALEPAVRSLVKRKVPRVVAVVFVEILTLLAVLSLLLLVVPIISKQIPLLREQIPRLFDWIQTEALPKLAHWGINVPLDTGHLKDVLLRLFGSNLQDGLQTVLNSALAGGGLLLSVLGTAVLVPLVLFYLLMDWPQMVVRIHGLIPKRLLHQTHSFVAEIDAMLGQYLRGQLLVMLILAVYYSVGLALFGFQLALPVGVFTGLAMCIPYLGFGLGLLLALFAGLMQFMSWYGLVAVGVVYGLGQVIESFFLTPQLVGERIGMHPLLVIFSLLAFGHLFGFVGVLVALPVGAVLVVAAGRLQTAYLASRLYSG